MKLLTTPLTLLTDNIFLLLTGTVTKRLQMNSGSSTDSFVCEEDLELYDEYLLSELMLANVKKNCQEGRDQGKSILIIFQKC